ncbi:MAG: type II toxin-antitoxin system PemK/MazF family toxin [Acidobacteriota bacterium]
MGPVSSRGPAQNKGAGAPVVVISHDGFNAGPNWRSVFVIPLTSSRGQLREAPSLTPVETNMLPSPSYAICHQITSLDRGKLRNFIAPPIRKP